ncbi:asparagine synthase (glutamine-hydrolyzing) [Legionella geestiana]|uniref:asparagine synthase (glutamine-hydrolyzing) n=1 Tax=Legionella geestiana TaxID=45065 RepID=UPI001651D1C9|nr:asparagine synthase (glutamine-hydrolyzing) [Legionella geestiana]
MCGIAGIVNLQNQSPVEQRLLEAMALSMEHRGPDGSGVWVQEDGQCGFSHRRLAIVDLSESGKQPMTVDGTTWLTFNGEIYNYPVLREELIRRGRRFHSNTDTEVILHMYHEYGDDFYLRLDGDFAFGLWDGRRRELLLARDRAGVKPLYYAFIDGKCIFASEIRALLKYPGMSREIDTEAFYHYLSFLVVPPPGTLVKNIFKLESASIMRIKPHASEPVQRKKYWLPIPQVNNSASFEALDEELETLFSAAVEKRLMADVPVGVLFSGGVDSSLNLGRFARLAAPAKVHTFTVGMEDLGSMSDERITARQIAQQLGSEHHELTISQQDLLQMSEHLALMQDEPLADPVSIPLYFITKMAREQGITVLHAGEGADELFCGYDNYRRFMHHHEKLWKPLSALPGWMSRFGSKIIGMSSNPTHRKITDVLIRRAKNQSFFMSSAIAYYEKEKQQILSAEFLRKNKQHDSWDVIAPYYASIEKLMPDSTFLQQITFIELQLRLPELLLMRADKMSMANSLEVRVPFLDRDIMDFAMRVPDAYKLQHGISKAPIKKLAEAHISHEAIYKRKNGFGLPIQQWFRGALGEGLLDMLSTETSELSDYLDRRAIENNLKHGLRTVNEAFQMWVIYNLLSWQSSLKTP